MYLLCRSMQEYLQLPASSANKRTYVAKFRIFNVKIIAFFDTNNKACVIIKECFLTVVCVNDK